MKSTIKIISLLLITIILMSIMVSCQNSDQVDKNILVGKWASKIESEEGYSGAVWQFYDNGEAVLTGYMKGIKLIEDFGEYSIDGNKIEVHFHSTDATDQTLTYYSSNGGYLENSKGAIFNKVQ